MVHDARRVAFGSPRHGPGVTGIASALSESAARPGGLLSPAVHVGRGRQQGSRELPRPETPGASDSEAASGHWRCRCGHSGCCRAPHATYVYPGGHGPRARPSAGRYSTCYCADSDRVVIRSPPDADFNGVHASDPDSDSTIPAPGQWTRSPSRCGGCQLERPGHCGHDSDLSVTRATGTFALGGFRLVRPGQWPSRAGPPAGASAPVPGRGRRPDSGSYGPGSQGQIAPLCPATLPADSESL